MLKGKWTTSVFVICIFSASIAATAQEVIHALTGTVTSTDAPAKTITVFTNDRSGGLFKDMTDPNTPIISDKNIRAVSTSVDTFNKKGAYAIIFYYGAGDGRTAVALRNLGAGPFSRDTGTIVKIDGKNSISIANGSGAINSFRLSATTVAETDYGAVVGYKYQPHMGDRVRVTAMAVNGNATALFINTLVVN